MVVAVWISDLVFGWAPSWLMLVVWIVLLVGNIFTFRMLWKQSDHTAFHSRPRSSDETGSKPSERP